jgi:Ca2+-binding RTX toxin-like protein
MKKTILIALAALGILAPAAKASTVTIASDGALVVTAGDEANNLGIQSDPTDETRVRFYEGKPGLTVTAPAPCDQLYDDLVSCPMPAAGVRLDLAGGDDSAYVSSDLANVPIVISGGAGNDWLRADTQTTTLDGGPGDDRLDGGKGADTLLGGDGKDQLDGREGADHLDGGAGDDVLNGDGNKSPSPDVLDGGPGYDTIESDWESSWDPVSITAGGGADDGFAGEGDDVRNVEKIQTHQPSTLIGGDAGEYLEVVQVTKPSAIRGNGGNDTLRGSDGAETLDGGPGDDDIDAGFGDDTITGGPGRDSIAGDRRGGDCGPVWCKLPYGNDTIDARDGEVDSVSCGFGEDTVYADPIDVVSGDCEHVTRDAAAGAPGAGPGAKLAVTAVKTRLAKALKSGLKLRVTTPGAGRITATASGAAGSAKAKKAGTTTVTLRFTAKASKSLRRKRSVKLAVRVRFGALNDSLKVTLKR